VAQVALAAEAELVMVLQTLMLMLEAKMLLMVA
jgi:hypothetical protein